MPTLIRDQKRFKRSTRTLVANRSRIVNGEDGEQIRLTAGRDRVDPEHWLAKKYPALFSELRGDRPSPRRSPTPRAAQKSPDPPLIRLSTATAPSLTIDVPRRCLLAMTDLAFAARGEYETGGALFGPPPSRREKTASIRIVGEPGPAARSNRTSMIMDVASVRQTAEAMRANESDLRHIGSGHTHPHDPSGIGEPSGTDLKFFAADLRETKHRSGYVGFILTPGLQQRDGYLIRGWLKPEIHAWHMVAVADDEYIVSRATVETRD